MALPRFLGDDGSPPRTETEAKEADRDWFFDMRSKPLRGTVDAPFDPGLTRAVPCGLKGVHAAPDGPVTAYRGSE